MTAEKIWHIFCDEMKIDNIGYFQNSYYETL